MSRSVGEFTLVGHLGEGSFATVFLARQRETGREFAMKAISRARVQGKLQENLESEISILKSFRHGNIVELYDIKKTERHIYLVLEYCAGGDLRALIRKEGKLTEASARHFMRHLGSGLHFLWSKNLVHRDLKPQNLLLTRQGLDATLKIADFGFARHLAQASMAETICGSPLYMAPEILQGHKYGAKADLWSVGAILFEMLAGKPPFGGQNQIQLLANIRRGPNPPAREGFYPLPEGVPRPGRSCNDLLCRLLVPDPQHRASFREFFQSDVLPPTPPLVVPLRCRARDALGGWREIVGTLPRRVNRMRGCPRETLRIFRRTSQPLPTTHITSSPSNNDSINSRGARWRANREETGTSRAPRAPGAGRGGECFPSRSASLSNSSRAHFVAAAVEVTKIVMTRGARHGRKGTGTPTPAPPPATRRRSTWSATAPRSRRGSLPWAHSLRLTRCRGGTASARGERRTSPPEEARARALPLGSPGPRRSISAGERWTRPEGPRVSVSSSSKCWR
ncbi:unnamed protein product [Scytosiphon promiscuus]